MTKQHDRRLAAQRQSTRIAADVIRATATAAIGRLAKLGAGDAGAGREVLLQLDAIRQALVDAVGQCGELEQRILTALETGTRASGVPQPGREEERD